MVRTDPALMAYWLTRRECSKRKLCAITGIAETTLGRMTLAPMPRDAAEQIAAYLGITIEHLQRGTGERRIAGVAS